MHFPRIVLRLCFSMLCTANAIAGTSFPVAVDSFAQPVLLGMQLSAQKGERKAEISAAHNACIQALTPSAFYVVVEEIMKSTLTENQLVIVDRFFATPVGRKYLKHGLLGIYPAVGERAPEVKPDFSDAEYKELEVFAATPAGQALITKRVMQSPSAKLAYDARIRELMEKCRAK